MNQTEPVKYIDKVQQRANENQIEHMRQGLETAFLNYQIESNLAYRPQFISNDFNTGRKVLASLEQELRNCDEFYMSVAFITEGGIAPLLPVLKELEKRQIPGKILTTNYLTFSEPKALEKLNSYNNIELRMSYVERGEAGFHTKGYIFREQEIYKIILGSSNMTSSALTVNKEWNAKLVSTEQGEIVKEILEEFNQLWENAKPLEDWIETYKKIYEAQKEMRRQSKVTTIQQYTLQPNSMQISFIQNLQKLREAKQKRALLISATGTGKTYASAFALRDMKPKKALFVVHREQIAKQAMASFQNVFGDTKRMGLLSGNSKDFEADFLFSTMQMMAKPEVREKFAREEFDVIIIDEVHRAGSNSYATIIEYFQPSFWLGMTASPERTDDFDIYKLFDHNVAYEIRLQQALKENLLCPFHYFGITDIEIDGETFDDKSKLQKFNLLTSDQRVNYIMEQIRYYGFSGEEVFGLVFCSCIEEAKELSKKFNDCGYRTIALTGEDSQDKREQVIHQFVDVSRYDKIDYIFTVDIFNEGVDIPEINQVIMLRPTQSPIVFVQQLGRGLRKADEKEYVVILDFIGNYTNNFMIPIALSGDRSYNKDTIRKYVAEGSRMIPGGSTVHFDEISSKRIFESIDRMKGIKRIIKESYQNLKYKMGCIPNLVDFYNNGEIDPTIILDHYKTYYQFLTEVMHEKLPYHLSEKDVITLEYLSRIIARGKRPHELEILTQLIQSNEISLSLVKEQIKEKYGIESDEKTMEAATLVLQGTFVGNETEAKRYEQMEILKASKLGLYQRMRSFYDRINHSGFRSQLEDLIQLGACRFQDIYNQKNRRRGVFTLYEKYSRRDVCQLLNWGKDLSSTMYGMKRVENDVALFVTYHKEESANEQEYLEGKPDYADEFINNQVFAWDSQIGKGPESSYMKDVKEAEHKHLFVKKSDAEGTDFYYMGEFSILEIQADKKKDNKGRLQDITKVYMQMKDIVREDLLEYLKN